MRIASFLLFILTVLLFVGFMPVTVFAASDETDPAVISVIETSDRGLGDLAAWQLGTNLGTLTLYCPIGVDSNGIVVIDGMFVNLTNNTVYFYSPEFPDYTFSAARFSPVYYRADNYSSQELQISSITRLSVNPVDYYGYVVAFSLIAIFLVCVWGCLKK